MLCSYDDLCYIICTVLRGRYCVIQHSCCNTNKTTIKNKVKKRIKKQASKQVDVLEKFGELIPAALRP